MNNENVPLCKRDVGAVPPLCEKLIGSIFRKRVIVKLLFLREPKGITMEDKKRGRKCLFGCFLCLFQAALERNRLNENLEFTKNHVNFFS